MDMREKRAGWLRAARKAAKYPSPAAFAKAHPEEIVETTYRSYENETRPLTERAARQYAPYFGVPWQRLFWGPTGTPPPEPNISNTPDLPPIVPAGEDYEPIVFLEIRPGMGGGGYEDLTDASTVLFPSRLVRTQLGARPDELRVVEVEGPSMLPMLESGDQVLVNIAKRNPSQPGIFCLFDGFGIVCKLVERIRGTDPPMLRIISANPLFKPDEVTEEEAHIIGRVVWFARRL